MTREELEHLKVQFNGAMQRMIFISRERDFGKEDFKTINWIARNLDRLRNHEPRELGWDEENKEVIVKDKVSWIEKNK